MGFKLIAIIISVMLISTSVYAMTKEEFVEIQQNNIIVLCDDAYGELPSNLLYECMLTEFYGLYKVVHLLATADFNSEDGKFLNNLMKEYEWKDFETFDFMAIHLEYEIYLKEKELENIKGKE